MNEYLRPNSGNEKPGSSPLLRDVLLDVHFKPGRVLPKDIDKINLGVFADEVRTLTNESFLSDGDVNFVKFVFVTGSRKVLVPRLAFKGGITGIYARVLASGVPKEVAERNKLNERYASMVIHTNNNTDLMLGGTSHPMLLSQDSFVAGISAVLITGGTQNMLTFRGENTPQLSQKEMEEKIRLWQWQFRERVSHFLKPGMTVEEIKQINYRASLALFRQICQKYDLQFFSGSSDQDEVERRSL